MSVASVINPEPSLIANRPATSLPSAVEVSSTATGPNDSATWPGSVLGADQVVVDRRVGDRQHSGRAVLADLGRHGLRAVAEDHDHRVAQPARQSDQLTRGLGHHALDQLGDNQHLSHADQPLASARSGGCSDVLAGGQELDQCGRPRPVLVRNHAAGLLGGRGSAEVTFDHAAARPTAPGSTPTSASVQTSTGFFLGRQDALHRRVTGLARLVGHTDHRRQRGLDGQARGVAVPPDRDRAVGHRQLGGHVAAGQPSRSAIMLGSTPMLPSVEAIPQITRSGAALRIAAASTVLVPTASEPCTASSLIWMPAPRPFGATA